MVTERPMQTAQDVIVVDHPLAGAKLSVLRSKTTSLESFRASLEQLSVLLLMEAARNWETRPVTVETPLAKSGGRSLSRPVTLIPILRAGLGMLEGVLRVMPEANIGHIGVYRDEKTLRPVTYFSRFPANLAAERVILLDPMLATGNSACHAVTVLKERGAAQIQFLCVVSCPPGIQQLRSCHPDVEIITAAVDPVLNEFGFIVPGLGDAGDRYFGTG